MSGPRQPAGPRAGWGRRTPGGARAAGAARPPRRPASPGRAAITPSTEVLSAEAAEDPSRGPAQGLSAWQLLLAQLDALLRDPTLTRALQAFARNVAAGVRGVMAATSHAVRELARALGRILSLRWARRALLALLALALPLALLSLLGSGDERAPDRNAGGSPQVTAAEVSGPSLGGVAMPDLRAAPDDARPVRVALVVDGAYSPATLRRELGSLGTWLSENHAPGTRVSVIDARSGRASGRLGAADLTNGVPARPRPSRAAAIRSAFRGQESRRLLVTVGAAAKPPPGTSRTLRVATRPGAGAGEINRSPGSRRSRVTIDDRRPNALAASVARAVMSMSGQSERR